VQTVKTRLKEIQLLPSTKGYIVKKVFSFSRLLLLEVQYKKPRLILRLLGYLNKQMVIYNGFNTVFCCLSAKPNLLR
jgi:hypothetical protein